MSMAVMEHLALACRTQRTDVIAHPSESTNVMEGVHETHDAGGGARANN